MNEQDLKFLDKFWTQNVINGIMNIHNAHHILDLYYKSDITFQLRQTSTVSTILEKIVESGFLCLKNRWLYQSLTLSSFYHIIEQYLLERENKQSLHISRDLDVQAVIDNFCNHNITDEDEREEVIKDLETRLKKTQSTIRPSQQT